MSANPNMLTQTAIDASEEPARRAWLPLLSRFSISPRTVRAVQYAMFPVGLLLVWWWATSAEWLPSNVLPAPDAVASAFVEMIRNGDLAEHLGISLWRVVKGALFGVSLGLALGMALGFSPAFDSWIGPTFRIVVQIPSIALIPLLMMVLGIDDALKFFIMVKACVIPLALISSEGIKNIPRSYLEVCRVMKLRRSTVYRKVIFPAALPSIFTGLRQGLAHVWVALVAVEILASADGIGYLITWSRLIFQIDVVLACIAVVGVIGFAIDTATRRLELRLLRWRGEAA